MEQHVYMVEPTGSKRIMVPRPPHQHERKTVVFGLLYLPPAVDEFLQPLIYQQDTDPDHVRFALGLDVIDGGGNVQAGLDLHLVAGSGVLHIFLPPPYGRWIGILSSHEVLLTTNPELIRSLENSVPERKIPLSTGKHASVVNFPIRTFELMDHVTFPIGDALASYWPMALAAMKRKAEAGNAQAQAVVDAFRAVKGK